ncbi:Hypothetical_protein [Hexamita inflata]|uniref:Hypothetical_protein n=1 Tax=Hexamita inflata TaxID=28002 RepID=A0AA86R5A1_9EUKA|nr:Hypothetical protein HINF_LOCUS53799 [Hexamita inflata]
MLIRKMVPLQHKALKQHGLTKSHQSEMQYQNQLKRASQNSSQTVAKHALKYQAKDNQIQKRKCSTLSHKLDSAQLVITAPKTTALLLLWVRVSSVNQARLHLIKSTKSGFSRLQLIITRCIQ